MLRDQSGQVEATWGGVEREAGHEQRCQQVHRRLRRIVKARGALDAQEAEALREADELRLWRYYGYSSLLEYMEMEMGYAPRVAIERLRVAKAIIVLPAIAEAMAQGDLSFSAGRELTRVATPETEGQWLEAASDKNVRQVEDLVSGHQPGDKPTDPVDPKLRKRRLRYDDIDPETVALVRQAREVLERELGDRLDDNAFLRSLARTITDGARPEQRSRAPYQIAITICNRCKTAAQDGGGITVEMSPATVETALCDAQHIGAVDGAAGNASPAAFAKSETTARAGSETTARARSETSTHARSETSTRARSETSTHARSETTTRPTPTSTRAKSDIPPALRRKVHARDHGKCRVPWCRSSRNIDQHHMTPLSQGGQHTLENLITLCESHHLAHHEGALEIAGTATDAFFTPRARSSFAIAERAVETRLALKALGFANHEVKAAVEKTLTHVGTTDLTLEHWIRIALSYCPKPRAT